MAKLRILAIPINSILNEYDYILLEDDLPQKFPDKNLVEVEILHSGMIIPSTLSMRASCKYWSSLWKKYGLPEHGSELEMAEHTINAIMKAKQEDPQLYRHLIICLFRSICPTTLIIEAAINFAKSRNANCILFALPFNININAVGASITTRPMPVIMVNFSAPYEEKLYVTMHELGHVMGLDHCSNPKCAMNPYAPKRPMETEYCPSCLEKIRRWAETEH